MRFLLLFVLSICIAFLTKYLLNMDVLIYENVSSKISTEELAHYLSFQNKWSWLSYVFIPLFMFIKLNVITSIFYIGTFFYSKTDVTFRSLFKIIVSGEYIFFGVGFLKIIWFYFYQTNYTLEDLQYFYPLSALNITGYKGLEPWLLYPLQTLNLFEVAYIIYLSYQIGYLTKTNADNGLKIVGYSYVPALLLWVTVVMFFSLNYS
jgi:hypothetical protein